jgi:hypothetical protein
LENVFDNEVCAATDVRGRTARSELAESLNQYVRRLRQARGFEEISWVLTDLAGKFCVGLAVFGIRDNIIQGNRLRAPLEPFVSKATNRL